MDDFFKRYRTRLKLSATEQLEETIEQVFHMIADDVALKNGIIIIRARYQQLEQDSFKGIITEADRVLRTNQILNSLFQLIDNITPADLQETEDVLLNDFLKKNKAEQAETGAPVKKPGQKNQPDQEMYNNASSAHDPKTSSENITPKSAKDLELFSEIHRKTLPFFSTIYRDVRTIVIRNEKPGIAIGQLIHDLEKALPAMEHFRQSVNQLEPVLKKVRIEPDKKKYWLQFQELSNHRTTLAQSNLLEIEKWNTTLEQFSAMLKQNGII